MDILKNTVVICSRKAHEIGTLNTAMKAGDPIKLSSIDFMPGQAKVQGEPFTCVMCGGKFAVDDMLHTYTGWQPADPVMEPVKKDKKFKRGQIKARANPNTIEKQQAKALKKLRKGKKVKA